MYFETRDEWLELMRAWAASIPRVTRVWLFGSRATGVRRPKDAQSPVPDLDVAYEIADEDGETAYSYHFHRIDRWRAELQAKLPITLDLQYSAIDDPDAHVPRFVAAGGLLIYRRGDRT